MHLDESDCGVDLVTLDGLVMFLALEMLRVAAEMVDTGLENIVTAVEMMPRWLLIFEW